MQGFTFEHSKTGFREYINAVDYPAAIKKLKNRLVITKSSYNINDFKLINE